MLKKIFEGENDARSLCPLCTSKLAYVGDRVNDYKACSVFESHALNGVIEYYCPNHRIRFGVLTSTFSNLPRSSDIVKYYNLMCERAMEHAYNQRDSSQYESLCFYTDEEIGEIIIPNRLFAKLNPIDTPIGFTAKMERILMNLYRKHSMYQDKIQISDYTSRLLFCEVLEKSAPFEVPRQSQSELGEEILKIIEFLIDLGFLKAIDLSHWYPRLAGVYSITVKGWEKISSLEKRGSDSGFVAMQYKSNDERYESIEKAITDCGFESKRMDKTEHNNQIVPEMFYEIKNSRFIVVDVTDDNLGAYYEAGYAEGVGKEVIVCCDLEKFKEHGSHFDIAQKAMILFENNEDLTDKLTKRILATVGRGNV